MPAASLGKHVKTNQPLVFRAIIAQSCDYSKGSTRIVYSVIMALTIIALSYVLFPNYCQSNDDCAIDSILSGSFTGNPDAHVIFINYVLALIMSLPYHIDPSVPWWGYMHILIQLVSVFAACKSLLRILSRTSIQFGLGLAGTFFALLSIFLYPVARTNFGVLSTLVGSSALLLIISIDCKTDSIPSIVGNGFLAAVMLILSYCYREQAFRVIAVMLVLVAVYQIAYALDRRKTSIMLVAVIAPAIICIGLLSAVNNAVYSDEEWESFFEFNPARAGYMDFHHYSYDENPAAFDSIGVSRDFAYLIYRFYVADDAVDADVYRHLNQYDAETSDEVNLIDSVIEQVQNQFVVQIDLLFCIVAVIASLLTLRSGQRSRWYAVFFAICLLVLSALFLVYLCYKGRPIMRALLAYCVPLSLLAIAFLFQRVRQVAFRKNHIVLLIIVAAVLLVGPYLSANELMNSGDKKTMDLKANRYDTFISYVDDHASKSGEQQVYFADYTACEDNKIFVSGRSNGQARSSYPLYGWYQNSPLTEEKREVLGIERCSPEMFTKPNAFFVSADQEYANALLSHINDTLGSDYSWEIVDELNYGLVVRRLR